jgi:L-alanine-DL-glutamate epimerase-like enolase superfamily enzyme
VAKIINIELMMVDLKPKNTRSDAIQSFLSQETPLLKIIDSDGCIGVGYTYTIGTGGSSIIKLLSDHLLPQLLNEEANNIEYIWNKLKFYTNSTSVGAITSLALAAIDTALWDLKAKKLKLSISSLLGGAKEKIPMYSTEGGWIHLSNKEIIDYALQMKENKFSGNKIKVGKDLSRDHLLLKELRKEVGDGFNIMCDANQSLSLPKAYRLTKLIEDYDITWLEEPFMADNISAHKNLVSHTFVPIAVGESMYSLQQFNNYLKQNACSYVQADVARVGGITPWLKIAYLCEAYEVELAPHFLMELHINIACGVQASKFVEYIPQLDSITKSSILIKDGYGYASKELGLGIDWDFEEINIKRINAHTEKFKS